MAQGSNASMRNSFEQRIGIRQFAFPHEHIWHGTLRTRYTDFQVHEITKDGEVVRLKEYFTNARDLARSVSQTTPQTTTDVPATTKPSSFPPVSEDPTREINSTTSSAKEELTEESKGGQDSSTAITPSDQSLLEDLVGQITTEELVALYTKIIQNPKAPPKSHGEVKTQSITDKAMRSQVHSEVRRIFGGKIDTATGNDDTIKAAATGGKNQRGNNRGRGDQSRGNRQNIAQERGGPFLHFSLYKENRDTMDALTHMARCLKVPPNVFGTAGTKDRRAVTVQRVSIKGRNPQSLIFLNNKIPSIKIGDFRYEQQPISLGSHNGNEFVVVLKNCSFSGTEDLSFEQALDVARSTVDSALSQIIRHGFINYYGTQRFGTHQIGTQEVGMKILKDDFEGAVRSLLSFDPALLHVSDQSQVGAARREDIGRARACSAFFENGDSQAALKYLPPRCNVERTIINHLGKQPRDFTGAIQSIHRSMRTMYVHAYQSLVWNFVASKRWEQFGSRVVKGDLVLLKLETPKTHGDGYNESSRDTSHLLEDDEAPEDPSGLQVHALTEEEANSGKYTIYDVVLPSPGWDVMYPPNEIGQFYSEFMAKEENGCLDPQNMRRRQRDFSLPGTYRKLMGKIIGTPTASIQVYSDDIEQLVPTDLDIIRSRRSKETQESEPNQQKAREGWHEFSRNVQQKELEESRARIEKRKAEELPPAPTAQISDTWVETSLDGDSKRVKIARHTEGTSDVKTEVKPNIPQYSDGSPQVESDNVHMRDVSTDNIAEDQLVSAEQKVQSLDQDDKKTNSPVVPAITTQVRAFATRFTEAIQYMMAALRIDTDHASMKLPSDVQPLPKSDIQACTIPGEEPSIDGSVNQTQSIPTSLVPEQTTNIGTISPSKSSDPPDTKPSIEKTPQSSSVSTHENSPSLLQESSATKPTDIKKIAVILRFALKTSQYATIVIRELQGDALVSEPKSNDMLPLASTMPLTERATASS
ncbi:pseudouridine synthase [Biscogniauxia sp. FL1348]|nr:pseudouridine synthase [Biscogniauxia sp. FL1348]